MMITQERHSARREKNPRRYIYYFYDTNNNVGCSSNLRNIVWHASFLIAFWPCIGIVDGVALSHLGLAVASAALLAVQYFLMVSVPPPLMYSISTTMCFLTLKRKKEVFSFSCGKSVSSNWQLSTLAYSGHQLSLSYLIIFRRLSSGSMSNKHWERQRQISEWVNCALSLLFIMTNVYAKDCSSFIANQFRSRVCGVA